MNAPLGRIRGGVHAPVRHDSAVGHVTGRALYLDDVPNVPGTLEAALVLSPHAHARIRHIDLVARARRARRGRGDHRRRHSGQERHRADPQRRAAARRRRGRIRRPAGGGDRGGDARSGARRREAGRDRLRAAARGAHDRGGDGARAIRLAAADHGPRRRRGGARRRAAPPAPANCAAAARIISISKARSRSPRPARTATCWCTARPSIRPRCSTASPICSGLPFNAVTVEVRRMGGAFGGKESQATIIAGIAALLAWKDARAGEAAAAARRRHARDRQAPSVPDPLRRRLRRRRAACWRST